MIAELGSRRSAGPLRYDVCIVGSGPAGITVAHELRDSGLRIVVLESGVERTTPHGDRLRETRSDGIAIKDWSRERVLGGASTTWAGLSSPMDDVDLAPRSYLRDSGWPIGPDELSRGYEEASERYGFPPPSAFEVRGDAGLGRLRAKGDLAPAWREVDEKLFLAAAEPQDFGRDHRSTFEGEAVDLLLDATVVELLPDAKSGDAGARVSAVRVLTADGREARVEARAFVLATGGIENARLLLLSRGAWPAGLGNSRDQVGRCLMNHPKNYHGFLRFAKPVTSLPYYFGCLEGGFAGYAGLRLPTAVQRERGLLNSYVRLEPMFPWTDSQGVEALVLFVKRSSSFLRSWRRRHGGEVVELRDYSETGDDSELQNARKSFLQWAKLPFVVLGDLPRVLRYLRFRLGRAKPLVRRARVRNFMEMEPDPENRVTLAEELDALGNPLPLVTHRCTDRDKASIAAVHDALAGELARLGIGVLEEPLDAGAEPWPIDQDASHHMGTTRMGTDPATSVCDPDLRLHEVENVFLAGASVFPSSGCANPTYTLVALSIRLARHLREVLGRGPR